TGLAALNVADHVPDRSSIHRRVDSGDFRVGFFDAVFAEMPDARRVCLQNGLYRLGLAYGNERHRFHRSARALTSLRNDRLDTLDVLSDHRTRGLPYAGRDRPRLWHFRACLAS